MSKLGRPIVNNYRSISQTIKCIYDIVMKEESSNKTNLPSLDPGKRNIASGSDISLKHHNQTVHEHTNWPGNSIQNKSASHYHF